MGACLSTRNRVNVDKKDAQRINFDELDANQAVDYAMQNAHSQNKIGKFEYMPSCKNLPNVDSFSVASPMIVFYIDSKTKLMNYDDMVRCSRMEGWAKEALEAADWVEYGRTEV